jgi:hypothetical protein
MNKGMGISDIERRLAEAIRVLCIVGDWDHRGRCVGEAWEEDNGEDWDAMVSRLRAPDEATGAT